MRGDFVGFMVWLGSLNFRGKWEGHFSTFSQLSGPLASYKRIFKRTTSAAWLPVSGSTDTSTLSWVYLETAHTSKNWTESTFFNFESRWYDRFFSFRTLWSTAWGLNKKWRLDKFPPQCTLKYNNRGVAVQKLNLPLKLKQFGPAFIILFTGYSLSLLSLCLERRSRKGLWCQ